MRSERNLFVGLSLVGGFVFSVLVPAMVTLVVVVTLIGPGEDGRARARTALPFVAAAWLGTLAFLGLRVALGRSPLPI
jgi:hypothetical protein